MKRKMSASAGNETPVCKLIAKTDVTVPVINRFSVFVFAVFLCVFQNTCQKCGPYLSEQIILSCLQNQPIFETGLLRLVCNTYCLTCNCTHFHDMTADHSNILMLSLL